jgi:hypothetical protein
MMTAAAAAQAKETTMATPDVPALETRTDLTAAAGRRETPLPATAVREALLQAIQHHDDQETVQRFSDLCRSDGIVKALESTQALAVIEAAVEHLRTMLHAGDGTRNTVADAASSGGLFC